MEKQLQKTDNIILIGDKSFMQYVSAITYQFTQNNQSEVIIKSRGKNNGKAIDLGQAMIHKFMPGVVKINKEKSDSVETPDRNDPNKKVRISTYEIVLAKV